VQNLSLNWSSDTTSSAGCAAASLAPSSPIGCGSTGGGGGGGGTAAGCCA
jgi:hypothetical protein